MLRLFPVLVSTLLLTPLALAPAAPVPPAARKPVLFHPTIEVTWGYGNGTSRKDRTWYAPGVGVVKWQGSEGRSKVLRSFESGR